VPPSSSVATITSVGGAELRGQRGDLVGVDDVVPEQREASQALTDQAQRPVGGRVPGKAGNNVRSASARKVDPVTGSSASTTLKITRDTAAKTEH